MSQTKLGLSALTLEAIAWAQLAIGGSGERELLIYFAAHGGASLLPARYSRPRRAVIGLLFGLIFFVPVMGFLGVLIAAAAPAILPRFALRAAHRVPLGAPARPRSA